MKAILEMEMPESCGKCMFENWDKWVLWACCLIKTNLNVSEIANIRHPDCPLKIVEEATHD
jgi:hypothetical protein